MVAIGNAVVIAAGSIWAGVGLAEGAVLVGLFCLAATIACTACLLVLRHGNLRLAGRLSVSIWLALLVYNALWLDTPTPDVPRSAHQYLLVLGMVSLLITRDDQAWFRHGVTLVSLATYGLLAGSHWSMGHAPPFGPEAHLAGAWFDHIVSVALLLVVMQVIHSDVVRRDGTAVELRDAILRDELTLHYQPLVNASGQVLGVEALVRWNHPQRGLIPPANFIPLAEECGLIGPLGEWVLRRGIAQLAAWQADADMPPLLLSVNVSAQQFEHPRFLPQLLGLLGRHGVQPSCLKLELTERMLAQDAQLVVDCMASLRDAGVQISLDDFGTGFSSLSMIKSLPLDQLKIDRSFVQNLGRAAKDDAIVRTIIGLGQTLGLDVIAEGVETPLQHQTLLRLGCHQFQGYLFGRPMPAQALRATLQPGSVIRPAVLQRRAAVPQPVDAAEPDTQPMPLG